MRKKRGFTLVELLVVIAIIALLMGIMMPALSRVRQMAYRMLCGTNLSGLGKVMLIYANDNDNEFPIAGARGTECADTGKIEDFDGQYDYEAFHQTQKKATGTSSLYLMIRYADASPSQFNCKGDQGVEEFSLDQVTVTLRDGVTDIRQLWDFGNEAVGQYCSYAYQHPYA